MTSPEHASTSAPTSAPLTFASLPPEVRRLVWKKTLTPRTLSIIPTLSFSPHIYANDPSSRLPFASDAPSRPCCLTFTVVEGLHPTLEATPYWAIPPFLSAIDAARGSSEWRRNGVLSINRKPYAHPVPRGPIALSVCRESRAAARETYRLAFGGVKQPNYESGRFTRMWEESGLGNPRVWVDFHRDTIFVVGAHRIMTEMSGLLPNTHQIPYYTEVLPRFALEDSGRIERLAVAGHWTLQESDRTTDAGLREALLNGVRQFPRLKTLLLYHSHTSLGELWRRDRFGSVTTAVKKPERAAEELRLEVIEALAAEKREDELWIQDIPDVEISRDVEWDFGERNFRLLVRSSAKS